MWSHDQQSATLTPKAKISYQKIQDNHKKTEKNKLKTEKYVKV